MERMSKVERLRAALQGKPVDRVPMSFWGHDYLREWSSQGLAEAMLERHFKFDWDWMKVNPRAGYHAQAWGSVYRPSGNPDEPPFPVEYPVKEVPDLDRIEPLDAGQGALGEQLEAISLIKARIDCPFVQTVFSSMGVLGHLIGMDPHRPSPKDPPLLLRFLKTDPGRAHRALRAITDTLAGYAVECLRRRASGIFFAPLKWASYNRMDEATYREFGRPYDLKFLEAVRGAEFNILHICDSQIMFEPLADYPVHAINWDIHAPGNPSLVAGCQRSRKTVMGGVNRETTLLGDRPEAVAEEVRAAAASMGGRQVIVSAGCGISPRVPDANLWAARKALD